MRSFTRLVLLLGIVSLLPTGLSARCRHERHLVPCYVVRHFHAGPDTSRDGIAYPDQGFVYVEDKDGPRGEDCYPGGQLHHVCVNPCCDCWRWCAGRCPLYDDSNNECVFENATHWPGKNESSWMYELDPW